MTDCSAGVKAKLEECIAAFKREIGYAGAIEVSDPHYRFRFLANRKDEPHWPGADEPGCYVFFSTKPAPGCQILYVGKGSRFMGTRIWSYFGRWDMAGGPTPFPDAVDWVIAHEPGFVAITVPPSHWWLAPALESFLIDCLKAKGEPLRNKRDR
jgi:hypothetical protein